MKKNNKSIKIISKSRKIKGTKKQRVQKHKKTQKRVFKLRGGNVEEVKKKYIELTNKAYTAYEKLIKEKYTIDTPIDIKNMTDTLKGITDFESLLETKIEAALDSQCYLPGNEGLQKDLDTDPQIIKIYELLDEMHSRCKEILDLINLRLELIKKMNYLIEKYSKYSFKGKTKFDLQNDLGDINIFLENVETDKQLKTFINTESPVILLKLSKIKPIIEEQIKTKTKTPREKEEERKKEILRKLKILASSCKRQEEKPFDFIKSLTEHNIDNGPSYKELESQLESQLKELEQE